MKRILAIIALAAVLLCMAGCGVRPAKVVGVWAREPLYMAYYGCETQMIISLAEDGSFAAMLLDTQTNNILNYTGGDWALDGKTILAKRTESLSQVDGDMEFTYNAWKDTLTFEGYEFQRTE